MVIQRMNRPLLAMVKAIITRDEFPLMNPGEWLALFRDPEKQKDLQV